MLDIETVLLYVRIERKCLRDGDEGRALVAIAD
jgi:hypothetical protein